MYPDYTCIFRWIFVFDFVSILSISALNCPDHGCTMELQMYHYSQSSKQHRYCLTAVDPGIL